MYRTFVLAPGAVLMEGVRPWVDEKCYKGKQKYKVSFDTQAQPIAIRQGPCKSGLTLSWFRIFLNAVSSHLLYQSFNLKVDLVKTHHFLAWGHLRQKIEEGRKSALDVMIPSTGFTSGIYLSYAKETLRTLFIIQNIVTSHLSSCLHHSNLRHSPVNLDLVSERCSHDPRFAGVMLESFPEVIAKEGWRGSVIRTSEMTSTTARLQGAKGSRSRKHHPPKAPSGPKEWNTVAQPGMAATKPQKARDSVPQVLPYHLREERKRDSGDWEIWNLSLNI